MSKSSSWFLNAAPSWAKAHVSHPDAAYMSAVTRLVEPTLALEIGVASGYSSAILLDALAAARPAVRPAAAPEVWLHSFDVLDYCYFDPQHPTGEAVSELAPSLARHWRLHKGDVRLARRLLEPGSVSLAFIDANHTHPWPTLDFLGILPLLASRAWVLLHDIRLAQLGQSSSTGPQLLFDAWPWAKGREPVQGNIGAIRIDGSHDEVRVLCARILEEPWLADVAKDVVNGVGEPDSDGELDARSPVARARLAAIEEYRDGRSLVLWGAGLAGRRMLAALHEARIHVAALLDRDPAKQGTTIEGVEVRGPHALDTMSPRPFVLLCGIHAHEMAVELAARGWTMADYQLA